MAFDPDAYLQKIEPAQAKAGEAKAQGFDPDAYLSKIDSEGGSGWKGTASKALDYAKMALSANPSMAIANALTDRAMKSPDVAGQHFANQAVMGYAPQIKAGVETGIDSAKNMLGMGETGPQQSYVQRRDDYVKHLADLEAQDPTAANIGKMGGVLSGLLTGGALAKVPGLARMAVAAAPEGANLLARGAALGQRALASGIGGAATMAAQNPGDVEGEVNPAQLGARAQNMGLGFALGVPLHVGLEGLGAAGQWASGKANDAAERLGFRALGPFKRQAGQNADKINEIGRAALDEGIIPRGFSLPASHERLAQRAEEAAEPIGQQIESTVQKIAATPGAPGVSRGQIASKMREDLIGNEGIPGVPERNDRFGKLIEEFEKGREAEAAKPVAESIPLTEARELKGAVKKEINWDRPRGADIPDQERFHRSLYHGLKEGEDQVAEQVAKDGGIEGADDFLNLKRRYGLVQRAGQIARNRADADNANRIIGLTDTMAGGAGAGVGAYMGGMAAGHAGAKVGAAVGGMAGGLGNKVMRTYGAQVGARGLDTTAKILQAFPQLAKQIASNPAAAPTLMRLLGLQDRMEGQASHRGEPEIPQSRAQAPDTSGRAPATEAPMPQEEAQKHFLEHN